MRFEDRTMKTKVYIVQLRRTAASIAFCFLIASVLFFLPAKTDASEKVPPSSVSTVFMIGNLNAVFKFPLQVYTPTPSGPILLDSWDVTNREIGPVGLAIDHINEHLFISYEMSDSIDAIDARDGTFLGSIYLYGTSDLAGMVVHQSREELYVVDRYQPNVFVFDTTTFSPVISWVLPVNAIGLDILDNLLFVTDGSTTIRWMNIDTHTLAGSFTQTCPASGIAVTNDPELTVFTTGYMSSTTTPYLTKYTVSSGLEETLDMGGNPKGVTLNTGLDYAYVTSENILETVDYETMTIVDSKFLNITWSPTDILASSMAQPPIVTKTCTSHPSGTINKGDSVVFSINIRNGHVNPIHLLPVRDNYDTSQLQYDHSVPVSDDQINDGVIDWSDLVASEGADLLTGQSYSIYVYFTAVDDCGGSSLLAGNNTAQTISPEDDYGTVLLNHSDIFQYTIDCGCINNAECDDGLFCNGPETCTPYGDCISDGNPCLIDDGIFCNGTEKGLCDEANDLCEHENVPCQDDGLYCNGNETCDETTDSCVNQNIPCGDDGIFCNGVEACNEDVDACDHSGDPCPTGTDCNEQTSSCDIVTTDDDLNDDDSSSDNDDDDAGSEDDENKDESSGCCG